MTTPMTASLLKSCVILTGLLTLIPAHSETTKDRDTRFAGAVMAGAYSTHVTADTDLQTSAQLTLLLNYAVMQNWGLEAGLNRLTEAETQYEADNVGGYKMSFHSNELLLGVYGTIPIDEARFWRLHGSAGWLRYRMTIQLEETFYDYKPGGTDSTTDQGNGYYVGLGVRRTAKNNLDVQIQVMHFQRLDVLGESTRPFDLSTTGASAGITMHF